MKDKFEMNVDEKIRVIFHNAIQVFVWKDWGKSWQISVGIICVNANIRTRHLPKERQKP
jgi:hypothetical protein